MRATLYFAIALALATPACLRRDDSVLLYAVGGEPKTGQRLIISYACGSCHVIPGVPDATGAVGPPLDGFGKQVYIAGSLPNTPENLFRWIRNPQDIEPGTAMPELGVSEEQARHIAAYLYTLDH